MTDKELKQLEEETIVMLKKNIRGMCQAKSLSELYLEAEVAKLHITNLRDFRALYDSKLESTTGKTGEGFIDETFWESDEE